jgi:hypothetical protein
MAVLLVQWLVVVGDTYSAFTQQKPTSKEATQLKHTDDACLHMALRYTNHHPLTSASNNSSKVQHGAGDLVCLLLIRNSIVSKGCLKVALKLPRGYSKLTLRCGICGFFFLWLSSSNSQVVIKK